MLQKECKIFGDIYLNTECFDFSTADVKSKVYNHRYNINSIKNARRKMNVSKRIMFC